MAKIRAITMKDNGEGEAIPASVTVELSLAEVLFISKFTGKQSHNTAEEVMTGGGDASTSLYHGLTGDVINRFWDGGTDEAVRDL